MAEFVIMLAIVVVCALLFGKADTKKELLNQVGLDLSKDRYETKKENEFKKYALQAMKKAIDLGYLGAEDEEDFLNFMSGKLDKALYESYVKNSWGGEDYIPPIDLGVKKHYVKHARRVINRRKEDRKKGNVTPLIRSIDFSDKKSAKRYCEILWEKYQYPWPEDWMQNDGF